MLHRQLCRSPHTEH